MKQEAAEKSRREKKGTHVTNYTASYSIRVCCTERKWGRMHCFRELLWFIPLRNEGN
jgi:hypothetical protein